MTANAWLQIGLYLAVLLVLVKPLGAYMARVYEGESVLLGKAFGPVERFFYRAAGVARDREMTWKDYALAMLVFNVAGLFVVYVLQRVQGLCRSIRRAWRPSRPTRRSIPRRASRRTRTGRATAAKRR